MGGEVDGPRRRWGHVKERVRSDFVPELPKVSEIGVREAGPFTEFWCVNVSLRFWVKQS